MQAQRPQAYADSCTFMFIQYALFFLVKETINFRRKSECNLLQSKLYTVMYST